MKFKLHTKGKNTIAELLDENQIINNLDDGLDLIGNADYNGVRAIILRAEQLHPDFFDLKTGLAGDILQKFSIYRVKLAIVGDFKSYGSNSLREFIFESNNQGDIIFVAGIEQAIEQFSK